jgi:hypothetical protein
MLMSRCYWVDTFSIVMMCNSVQSPHSVKKKSWVILTASSVAVFTFSHTAVQSRCIGTASYVQLHTCTVSSEHDKEYSARLAQGLRPGNSKRAAGSWSSKQ